ncbi:uncharacterized protein [Drosophila takahashii]|uniref:uncharacterized protein n=1 Tax=Drosophila takahashii TaxID=29030 RepID=UPI001CF7ED8C|nr:uncharacterized protein LOC123003096 [Drosophila takahashii]
MPGSASPPPRPHILQQDHQGSTAGISTYPWALVIEKLNRANGEQLGRSGAKCVKCQTSDSISIINSISNATGSGGESESANPSASAQVQSAVYSGSAILCSVNSENNTRKLNLILSKQQRGEHFAVGTNLQNKLPTSSADCHLSPSAETNTRTTASPSPPRSPSCPPCPYRPYSHLRRHRHRHSQHHHYRHRGCRCRCRCRCRDAPQSASASPASMLLPYQINQRATLLQQSAAAAATTQATAATSTTLPHVPGATTTSLRAVPRIFKRKRDTVQTATTASPLTPQPQPTVAAATSATSNTTTTRRSRLQFILYTEVYEVEGHSISPGDSHSKSNVGSSDSLWQKYGE